MADKLSLYLVSTHSPDSPTTTVRLIVAESAGQAEKAVADVAGYDEHLDDVGRLGFYEPGVEGHRMVSAISTGLIVMSATRPRRDHT